MDQEFVSSLARWLWLPVSHEVIVQMLAGFTVICRSGWVERATSSSVTWRLSRSLGFSPCRTPWWPSSLSASDLRDRQSQTRERKVTMEATGPFYGLISKAEHCHFRFIPFVRSELQILAHIQEEED